MEDQVHSVVQTVSFKIFHILLQIYSFASFVKEQEILIVVLMEVQVPIAVLMVSFCFKIKTF